MASDRVLDDEGNSFIPSSQRPDGSWRKPRKVKTGYVPQDEQPLYESKGRQIANNKPTFPVGLTVDQMLAHSSEQKTKKKAGTTVNPAGIPGLQDVTVKKRGRGHKAETFSELRAIDRTPAAGGGNQKLSPEDRKLNTLKKKLYDIDNLRARIESGELAAPEKTQLEKIERREEVVKEIEALEASMRSLSVSG